MLCGFAMNSVQQSSLFKRAALSHGVLLNRGIRHGTPKGSVFILTFQSTLHYRKWRESDRNSANNSTGKYPAFMYQHITTTYF